MRILILSHGHPELSTGGAERAAYSLFQRLKTHPDVTKAVFVACAERDAIGHDAHFGSFRSRADEILIAPPPVDGFTFQTLAYDTLHQLVGELIKAVKPDVVHVHHFIFWGIEIFELFKRAGVRVVFTFHEYAAICTHFGQMVKVDGRLCHAASPAECGLCFPTVSAGKFFIRNTLLKTMLDAVDQFVAPSEFLKERFSAWGIPTDRIAVIENLLDPTLLSRARARVTPTPATSSATALIEGKRTVFGYFGQINPFKGVDVLLEAAALLPEEVRQQTTIRTHGENRNFVETDFHKRFQALLADVRDVVSPMGGYRGEDVLDLMSDCDWIIVPSIWWENSPIVIQEARLAACPLITSNIGGMVEKIDPTVDHLFPVKSPGALANLITELVTQGKEPRKEHLRRLAEARIQDDEVHFVRHYAVYDELLSAANSS